MVSGLFDFTINSKQDLKFISKDSRIKNLYINYKCKLDGYYCTNIYVNDEVILTNCIVDESIIINNPKNFILIRNCMIGEIKCNNIGNYNLSLHIEHNIIYEDIEFKEFNKLNKNVSIYIYQNEINKQVLIFNNGLELSDAAICVSSNRFSNADKNNIFAEKTELVDVKDNYFLEGYKIKFIDFKQFDNHTGYNRKKLGNSVSFYVTEVEYRKKHTAPNKILRVNNIPQYISFDNDPALKTGCEATACAIALSYILNKPITKNEIVKYMQIKESGTSSFWDAFIGDIYNDGWGCMSPVSVDTINRYLIENNLDKEYYVFNSTNMPLYELLEFVNSGIPVIVWCTMGDKDKMYHKKHGSTIWNVDGEKLYWPGNDHSVVIAGYSYTYNKIYLADPENNKTDLISRDIYEFENRFMELYSQSVVILKKKHTR